MPTGEFHPLRCQDDGTILRVCPFHPENCTSPYHRLPQNIYNLVHKKARVQIFQN